MIEDLKKMLEREKEILNNPYLSPTNYQIGYLSALEVIQKWIEDKEASQDDMFKRAEAERQAGLERFRRKYVGE